jgi:hypothetical protein
VSCVTATSNEGERVVIVGSGKAGDLWNELNPRQCSYLIVCYQHDQEVSSGGHGRPSRKLATAQRRQLRLSE